MVVKQELINLIQLLIESGQIKVLEYDGEVATPDYTDNALRAISNAYFLSDLDLLAGMFCDTAREASGEFAMANLDPCQITFANLGKRLVQLCNKDLITDLVNDIVSESEIEGMLTEYHQLELHTAAIDACDDEPWDIEPRFAGIERHRASRF